MTDTFDPPLAAQIASAYDASARSWASGATIVYAGLADALVARLDDADARGPVLDLCAGAGAASVSLVRRAARVIALDFAWSMLVVERDRRPPAVAGDANRLPFRSACFSAVVVACGLNHAPDPVAFLVEAGRVTRVGGVVLTSTFARGWDHPAKAAVDEVLTGLGYRAPAWHASLKHDVEPVTATPERLVDVATRAGLGDVSVERVDVAVDVSPEQAVEWRFAMASHAPFVASLASSVRDRAAAAAAALVGRHWVPVCPPLLILHARA